MSEVGRKVLRDTKFLLVDATFQICQKPHEQLLTIHAQVKRSEDGVRVNMPVAFALMHNRSESAYKAVFQKIKDIVEEDGSSLRVKEFIVDYEKAIWNALRAVFVNAHVRGCWFHFCQCIIRKARELELTDAFFNHNRVHKMLKRLMCLHLIDKNNIPKLFDDLKWKYRNQIRDTPGVKALFEYFETQWIQGRGAAGFKPEDYSCFGQPIRTTNIVESWNSSIYKAGKRKKHDIYQLAILLARENARCEDNVAQYGAKKYKRRRQVEKEKGIKKAYDVYDTNKKLWELLERLREATTNTIRYPIAVDEQE